MKNFRIFFLILLVSSTSGRPWESASGYILVSSAKFSRTAMPWWQDPRSKPGRLARPGGVDAASTFWRVSPAIQWFICSMFNQQRYNDPYVHCSITNSNMIYRLIPENYQCVTTRWHPRRVDAGGECEAAQLQGEDGSALGRVDIKVTLFISDHWARSRLQWLFFSSI